MLILSQLLSINLSDSCSCSSFEDFQNDNDVNKATLPVLMLLKAPLFMRSVLAAFFERVMDDHTAANIIRSIGLGPGLYSSSSNVSWSRVLFWWWYALKWILSSFGARGRGGSSMDVLKLEAEKEDFQRQFAEMWNENDLDALICPVHAVPPAPSSAFPFISAGASYSMLFSFLDYPAGVIPNITRVTNEDRIPDTLAYVHGRDSPTRPKSREFGATSNNPGKRAPPSHIPDSQIFPVGIDQAGKISMTRKVEVIDVPSLPVQPPDPNNAASTIIKPRFNFLGILGIEEYNNMLTSLSGVGVGIQVVGRRFCEESVLGVMEIIDKL